MHYRLFAIDLDGTLLDGRGRLSSRNVEAISAAESAGAMIVPCTGRMWRESRTVVDQLPSHGPGVFVSGAAVSDMATGSSLDIAVIEPNLAEELVQFLRDIPEAVLVCRESAQCGHDYLVTGNGTLTPSTQWWFEATGATVHFQKQVGTHDLHHTLRIGVVANGKRVPLLCDQLRDHFGDRIWVHGFQAVQTPDGHESVYVLEVFATGVNKWRGLEWIAHEHGIDAKAIVAIGDEINDVSMVRRAGCGVAMANAIEQVKEAADHVTLSHERDGVAHAIEQIITGRWGI